MQAIRESPGRKPSCRTISGGPRLVNMSKNMSRSVEGADSTAATPSMITSGTPNCGGPLGTNPHQFPTSGTGGSQNLRVQGATTSAGGDGPFHQVHPGLPHEWTLLLLWENFITDHFTRYTLAFPMNGHSAAAAPLGEFHHQVQCTGKVGVLTMKKHLQVSCLQNCVFFQISSRKGPCPITRKPMARLNRWTKP